jgi:hypothetical protein
MVLLLQALSHPSLEWKLLSEKLDEPSWKRRRPKPTFVTKRTRAGHHRPGVVRDAVRQVLAEACEPLTVRQIRERVEALLSSSISASSVKECLKRETQ